MAKQNLLLVDADLRSLRVLEVSLRKAGYNVASIGNARDALGMLEQSRPDLVLCDTRLPGMDGFELIQEMRKRPDLADVPLMILSSDVSVETKVRGLQLGVEDYLTKPIYIKELLARVSIVLQRKRREGIEQLDHGNKRRFSGSLSDMGVVDLLQAADHNKKSGVLYLHSSSSEAAIYFRNGAPVDATVGPLHGARAIYRTLLWTDGTFEIDFREVDREDRVQTGMQALLMEGLRRVDEWGRLLEQLPDMDTVFEVSEAQLFSRLGEIPDQINSVLREVDGERSLWQILDACEGDDLETLNALSKLYFEGLLYNTGRRANKSTPRAYEQELEAEPSEIVLPHISSGPPGVITQTLAPAWPSVPSGDQAWTRVDDDTFQINIPSAPRLPEEPILSLNESPKQRKGRKRKRRGSSQSLAAGAAKKPAAREPEEADVQDVDENVAEITPSTIAPPPEVAEAARAASVPPPLPATSRPAKPDSWPPEPSTSEVSLAQLSEAGAEADAFPELADVLSDESVSRDITAAPAALTGTPPPLPAASMPPGYVTPPPLPSVGPRASIPDSADITILPGAPSTYAETSRPVGPATVPPLSAASSAPPGPTTLRPQSALGWEVPAGPLLTAAADSSREEKTSSGPVLDAEAAADLTLADVTDIAALDPDAALATTPPVDAETAADLSFSESPVDIAATQPPLGAAASTRPLLSMIPLLATKTGRPEGAPTAASSPPLEAEAAAERRGPPPILSIVPPLAMRTERPEQATSAAPRSPAAGESATPPGLAEVANATARRSSSPPPLPITSGASVPRQSLQPPPASDLDVNLAASLLAAANEAERDELARSSDNLSEANLLAASRASMAPAPERSAVVRTSLPANSLQPPDLDAAAARLAGAKRKSAEAQSIPALGSVTPSLRHKNVSLRAATQPATTAKPPPFSAVPSTSQSSFPGAADSALYRTELASALGAAEAANDNASGAPPLRERNAAKSDISALADTASEPAAPQPNELSDFAKVALARSSTPPDPAAANDSDVNSDSLASNDLLSAALSASSKTVSETQEAAEEAPEPASEAPPTAASAAVSDGLSGMPTAEVVAVTPEPSVAPKPVSQGVWSAPSKAPSTAAPALKRRPTRWMQVGSVAAATALAAGLYALRARDAAPEGSLIRAVPTEQVTTKPMEPSAEQAPKAPSKPEPQKAQAPAPEEGPELVDEPERAAGQQAADSERPEAQAANTQPASPQPASSAQAEQQTPPSAAPPSATKVEANAGAKPAAPANAEQVIAKGHSLEQKGKKKDALALYEKTVAEGGGSSQLLSHMAFMYLNQGNNAQAEANALKASAADETNSEAWIVLGAARSGLGKKQAADEAYRSCAKKGQGQYVTECRRMLR